MRRRRPRPVHLRPSYSSGQYLVAALLCVAATVAMLVAVAYPAAVVGALLGAGATVAGGTLVRAARARDPRQPDVESRRVCVPATDVCLEA